MVQTSSERGIKNIKTLPKCAMRVVQGKKYCINYNTGWKCYVNRLANNFAESGADVGLFCPEYGFGVRIETIS